MLDKSLSFNIRNSIYFLLAYLVIFLIQFYTLSSLVYLIFFTTLIITIFNKSLGVILYFLLIFSFDDYPLDMKTIDTFSSLFNVSFFGQTLTKLWSILILLIILNDLIRGTVSLPKNILFKVVNLIFIISFVFGILNGGLENLNSFTNDARFYINFLIGYLGIFLYVKDSYKLLNLYKIFSLVFLGKLIIVSIQAILIKSDHDFFVSVGDSGFIFAPTFLIIYYIFSKNKPSLIIYISIILCILSFGLSVSRGKIVLLIIQSVLFLFITLRFKKIPIIATSILIFLTLVLPLINSSLYNSFIWKLSTFNPYAESANSSMVRIVEYQNIIYKNLNSLPEFIFGQGLGGSWTSEYVKYPFSLYGTDSYPEEWIKKDQYFKPHGIIQFIILKFGFGGFIIIYTTIIKLIIKYKKIHREFMRTKKGESTYLLFMCLMFAAVCSLFLISYSTKHQLFLGVFIASASIFEQKILRSLKFN
jgi:hypothetical protein